MAISLSQSIINQRKQSIADKLATQTADLQGQPWWKTVGSIALPLIASLAMPGIGTALAGWAGSGGALAGILGTGKTAAAIAKGIGALGTGLQKAKTGTGILKTLGMLGTKTAYSAGAGALSRGLLGGLDKRSAKDIKLSGPSEMLYGGDAVKKLRGQYRRAKEAEKETGIAGSVLSAFLSQGLGNIGDAFKVGLFSDKIPKGVSMLQGLTKGGLDKAQQIAKTANIMGGQIIDPKTGEVIRGQIGQAGPLQQIMSGQKMITDPSLMGMTEPGIQAVGQQTGLQNLLGQQMSDLTGQYDFGTNLIKDASQRGRFDSIVSKLSQQSSNVTGLGPYGGISPQVPLGLNAVSPGMSQEEYAKALWNAYLNYEDIPKGWE